MRKHVNDDRRANLYATVACCIVLLSIAVALRFIARGRIRAPFKADDYLVLSTIVIVQLFRKSDQLRLQTEQVPLIGMDVFTALATYAGMGRHVLFAIAILVLAYSLALVIVAFVQCIPLSATWAPTDHAICINTEPAYTTTALSKSFRSTAHRGRTTFGTVDYLQALDRESSFSET